MPGCMSEAPRSDVLDLKDEALLQKLKDEGLAARFYGPTAAESVDSSLTGKALSRRQGRLALHRGQAWTFMPSTH